MGAYDGWIPLTVGAMWRLGSPQDAFEFYCRTAGVTREARVNMGRIAAEQILDALDGKRPPRIVNPEVWAAYAKRFEKAFGFAPK